MTVGTTDNVKSEEKLGCIVCNCGVHDSWGVGVTCVHPLPAFQVAYMSPNTHLAVTPPVASPVARNVADAFTSRGTSKVTLKGKPATLKLMTVVEGMTGNTLS